LDNNTDSERTVKTTKVPITWPRLLCVLALAGLFLAWNGRDSPKNPADPGAGIYSLASGDPERPGDASEESQSPATSRKVDVESYRVESYRVESYRLPSMDYIDDDTFLLSFIEQLPGADPATVPAGAKPPKRSAPTFVVTWPDSDDGADDCALPVHSTLNDIDARDLSARHRNR